MVKLLNYLYNVYDFLTLTVFYGLLIDKKILEDDVDLFYILKKYKRARRSRYRKNGTNCGFYIINHRGKEYIFGDNYKHEYFIFFDNKFYKIITKESWLFYDKFVSYTRNYVLGLCISGNLIDLPLYHGYMNNEFLWKRNKLL